MTEETLKHSQTSWSRLLIKRNLKMKRFLIRAWIFVIFLSFWACRDKSTEVEEYYLIWVGDEIFTVEEFQQSFEVAKIAYMDEISADPETLREIQTRHLKEIIDELIVLERAKELHLEISDQELENAVWKIKKDYPEESFEQTLLEKAICFSRWKESLRIKLLKERVIFEELEKNIPIINEEIKDFIESYFESTFITPENEKKTIVLSQEIIRQLRKEKAKEQYPSWIKELRIRYDVKLNKAAWSKIMNFES
jgi:hypothetical protein